MKAVIPNHNIAQKIHAIRDMQVMLDSDLADVYGVETKIFNQAVKRNIERFPKEFRFQLTEKEHKHLRSQVVTSSKHGGRRYLPYVFSEQGVAMLSAVLKSKTAVEVSIKIISAFVEMWTFIAKHGELVNKLQSLEKRQIYFELIENKTIVQESFSDFDSFARSSEIIFEVKNFQNANGTAGKIDPDLDDRQTV